MMLSDPDLLSGKFDPATRVAIAESRRIALERIAAKQHPPDPVSNRLVALEQRIGAIEASLGEGGEFVDGMIHGIGEVMRTLRSEISEVRREVQELRTRQVVFRGVHQEGAMYQAGDLAIRQGGLWWCRQATVSPPGSDPNSWMLAVKKGAVDQRGAAIA